MRARASFVAAAVTLCAAVLAAESTAPTYRLRAGDSSVSYGIQKWGVIPETGEFRDVRGAVAYAPAAPEASSIDVRIAVASLDSGLPRRDETLLSEDFFDAGRFPEMRFRSVRVEPAGEHALRVTGDLTIRDRTRRITVPVAVLGVGHDGEDQELVAFESRFRIDRRDFGVLGTRWSGGRALLAHEVDIHLVLAASRPARPPAAATGGK